MKKAEEGDQQMMSSNTIQKRSNTVVHLKVDDAMEGRRSHKGNEERVGGEPSLLSVRPTAHAKAPQTLQVHVSPTGTSFVKCK